MDISGLYGQMFNSQSSGISGLDSSNLNLDTLVSSIQMSFWDTYLNILGGDNEEDSEYGFLSNSMFGQSSSSDNGSGILGQLSSMGLGSLGLNSDISGFSGLGGFDASLFGLNGLSSLNLDNPGLNNFDSYYKALGIQINQFDAEKQAGGDGANANCGPASLAMALKALGTRTTLTDGELVDRIRALMVDDLDRDGIGASGERLEWEHNSFTNFTDLQNGADALGLQNNIIKADALTIQNALLSGRKVITSGTFTNKYPLPWTGDRLHDSNSAPGGATDHFVTITDYNVQRGEFLINDPARRSPLWISKSTLEYFMQGNAGAISLSY